MIPVLQVIAVTSCDPLCTDTDANSICNRACVAHKHTSILIPLFINTLFLRRHYTAALCPSCALSSDMSSARFTQTPAEGDGAMFNSISLRLVVSFNRRDSARRALSYHDKSGGRRRRALVLQQTF